MKELFAEIMSGDQPDFAECATRLSRDLDLITQFSNTPQDPGWHAEGDVYVHTDMVLREVYALVNGPAAHLDTRRRGLVVLGALLHDIAKPICTRWAEIRGTERWTARGHEAQGRSYLAPRLIDCGLDYSELETLLGLVGYHHEPKFLVVKDRPIHHYRHLCRLADPELLYWVELADMRGRTCPDWDEGIEQIELFRMFCQEHGTTQRGGDHLAALHQMLEESLGEHSDDTRDLVLGASLRSLEDGTIQSVEEALARSFSYRESFSDLVILVGPSGSGKSTWIDRYLPTFDNVSLDDLRVEIAGGRSDQASNGRVLAEARERLRISLRAKRPVVWDATNLRKDFRSRIAQLGFDYGALVTLVVLHTEPSVTKKRNVTRTHSISAGVQQQQLDKFQWPELDEGHRILFLDQDFAVLSHFGVTGQLPYGLKGATCP